MSFINPTIYSLQDTFVNTMLTIKTSNVSSANIQIALFIIIIILIFLVLWLPYLSKLKYKIWRTKGMLNMIPLEILTKHESFKK